VTGCHIQFIVDKVTSCHIHVLGGSWLPKQTFFNLPEEKQATILDAAKREFARVPFAKASISNIIKDADISRGSFYQYFANKEDLFFYLLENIVKESHIQSIDTLKKHNGDIFAAITEIFHSTLEELNDKNLQSFYKNLFLHLDYKTEQTVINNISAYGLDKRFSEFREYIDTTNLNVNNDEELFHVIQMTAAMMMQNFVKKFAKNLTNEEVKKTYSMQLDLLKRGFLK